MATSGDDRKSNKQVGKPASKGARTTKVERGKSLASTLYRANAAKNADIPFREKIKKRAQSEEVNRLVRVEKSNTNTYNDGHFHKKLYEKDLSYGTVGSLNDKVTSLASHISSSYSLDRKESEKLARVASAAIDRAVAEHLAGKPLSLEPTFKPAAEGADAPIPSLRLPDAPPKYPYAPRMEGGIVKYLEDNWAAYIEAGLMTRPDLARIDPDAYQALRNWLRQNDLPRHIYLPTVSEGIDREIEELGGAQRIRRLAAALAARDRKNPREP